MTARRGGLTRPNVLIVAGMVVVAIACAACAKPSAQRLNEDGNRAYNRGDFSQALDDYRKAQVDRPDLTIFSYNAGNTLQQQGDYTRAVTESLRAARNGGDTDVRLRSFYSIGADYFRQGKLREALDAYKSALRIDPSDVDTKYNLEVIQRQLDKEAAQRQQNAQQAQQQNQNNQQPAQQQGQQQGQQNQPGQPSAGQRSRPGQGGQQPADPQTGQPGQAGQQAGQSAHGSNGQAGQGQPGAAGQQQQPGQNGQPGQGTSGQPGSASGQGAPSAASTAQPSVRQQQAQLGQDLRNALQDYDKQPTIDEALRILDILAEQERIAQAQQGAPADPKSVDK